MPKTTNLPISVREIILIIAIFAVIFGFLLRLIALFYFGVFLIILLIVERFFGVILYPGRSREFLE